MAKLIKVLLAEGHLPTEHAISSELAAMPHVDLIATVLCGRDVIIHLDRSDDLPDVILMDVNIDVQHSFWCARKLASKYPSIRLIVLGNSDETLCIRKLIDLGASGYILKEYCNEGLHYWLSRGVTQPATLINIEYTSSKSKKDSDGTHLDQKETAVLRLLMNQYSSMEISEELSMESEEIDETFERLNRKTNSSNQLDLKRYAFRHAIY